MEAIDASGNVFGWGPLIINGPDGKLKTIVGGGGSPSGPAGGDLSGTYPNPLVNWSNGVSTYDAYYLNLVGGTLTGPLILDADPITALGAATKQYVDNIVAGINFHAPVHAATTGNLSAVYSNGTGGVGATLIATSNGALIVDGHTMLAGERVLVWQQSSGLENGIYDVSSTGSPTTPFKLTRSADADNSPAGEIAYGDFTFVQQGSTYGGFGFICNTPGTITIGVTAISYVQFNAAQVITAGYGLQELTPNVLSVDTSVIATVSSLSSYLTTASAASTYYPLTNPSGYLSSITSSDVITALGYTPYNSSNPAGYITSAALSGYLTSATAAATYYPLTNPSNYITSAALSPYLLSATAALTYYPKPTGTTSQYIRGDGSLATFPSLTGYVPYTGATTSLQMGNHSVTADDGSFNSILSSNVIGVQNTANTLYGIIDYSKVEISDIGTGNTMLMESTGLTFPNASVQTTAGVTSVTGTSPIVSSGGLTPAISIPKATASVNGYLASTDFSTFNGKQAALSGTGIVKSTAGTISYLTDNTSNWDTAYTNRITSLTTTGSSGAATLLSNTLNIPTYTLTGLGGVATTRTISTTTPLSGGGDLSVNRTLSIADAAADGTTKGAATFNASDFNATAGLISIDYASGQSASTTNKGFLTNTDWNTFNGKQNTFSRLINGVTFDATADIQVDPNITFYQQLGSQVKAFGLGLPIHVATLATNMASGLMTMTYTPILVSGTITGVKFFQTTQGVYTANNYNGVGLYTISGGTLTLVASSTNDGNIWKGTANTWQTKAFTTPYTATAGVYFVAFLYSSSAQTTAPAVMNHNNLTNNIVTMDFTNSVKIVSTFTGATALPTTQLMSGLSLNGTACRAFILY